jgi:hypothetical protein
MATTPSIADQLRAYQESLEYANRTAEAIKDQRDLLKEVVNQARRVGVEFNKHTENIGDSVSEIKLFETTEVALQNALRDRNVVESSLLKQLKNRSIVQQQMELAQRLTNSSTRAGALDELNNKRKLIIEQQRAGIISKADAVEQLKNIKNLRNSGPAYLSTLQRQASYQDSYIAKTRDNLKLENIALDKLKIKNGFMQVGKKVLGDMGPLGSAITESFNVAKMNPWVAAAQAATVILEKGYENFKAFDKASVDVRKNLGALPGQASALERNLKTVTVDMMHLGATFDDVAKSMNAIADEFNRSVAEDTKLVTTTTALAKQFGITEAVSAKFLKTIGGISGKSTSSQRAMLGFAQKMASAAGVPLAKIMQDVSEATDDVRIYIGASATSIIKAATAARMMGIDLNKAAASAQKLLDCESSIASELKASALLGQNINFNYARQLFFNKNIIAANKEILRLTKQVNFNQLDPIKQKAFADAAGKTVGELQDMLTTEKNMQLVANSTDKNIQKRYQEYQRLMQLKAQEAEDEGKIAEQEFLRKANQEKLLQIQNRFNQLMSQLAEPVMEVTEFLLDIATEIMPYVIDGIRLGILLFGTLKVAISKITTPLAAWVAATEAFIGPLLRSRAVLLSIGKIALSTLGFIGKWLNPIGWIITAFQSIAGIITQWKKLMSDFEGPIWNKILLGIYAISSGIIKGLLGPFDFVIDKLDKIWFGKSPSMVGKNILKGITSIGPGLQDSLTTPINSAYSEIEKMSPPEIGVENAATNKLAEKSDNALISAIQTGNQQLAAKIDQLMTMMANGGIAVNIDGQLINRALSTTSLKSGGFGQATTRA